MKNRSKNDKTLYMLGFMTALAFLALGILCFTFIQGEVITLRLEPEIFEESTSVFSEELWRKQLELYLEFQNKERKQDVDSASSEKPSNEILSEDIQKSKAKEEVPKKALEAREAFIFSSLTSSPGSVAVSGKASGYRVSLNGTPVEISNGKFSSGASSSFTIVFENDKEKRVVHVSSPPYNTNLAVQYLTIGIDPFASYMTLHVKLNLKLPGTMTGELINLSSGAGSSTNTQNGEFNLSIPLIEGNNSITARGSWLTISLDLPSINIKLSN